MLHREPAVTIATIVSFLTAALGLGAAFGLNISDDTKEQIIAVVVTAAPIVLAIGPIIRQFVYSPKTVEREVTQAFAKGRHGEAPPKLAA